MTTTHRILSIVVSLVLVIGLSRIAVAVTANVDLVVVDADAKPVKFDTIILTPKAGGASLTEQNNDDDNEIAGLILQGDTQYVVDIVDKEGNKKRGGVLVPLKGGKLQVIVGPVSWWEGRSQTEKFLTVLVPTVVVGGVALAISDDDNDGDAAQNAGGGTTAPPAQDPGQPDPGPGDQDQTPTFTLNDCADQVFSVNFGGFSSQGGCPNQFTGQVGQCALISGGGSVKTLNCGPNIFELSGNFDPNSGSYNATGTNAYSIVPAAPYQVNATFTLSGNACTFGGTLQVGPPLVNPGEQCVWSSFTGSANLGAIGP